MKASAATPPTASGPTSEQVGACAYPHAWQLKQLVETKQWDVMESVPRWLLSDATSLELPKEHIERVRYTAHLVTELIEQNRKLYHLLGAINARKSDASMDT